MTHFQARAETMTILFIGCFEAIERFSDLYKDMENEEISRQKAIAWK